MPFLREVVAFYSKETSNMGASLRNYRKSRLKAHGYRGMKDGFSPSQNC
jgi:hypothetical protein